MDDGEAAQVRDGALEALVLRATDERGVEAVALERAADVRVASHYVVHESSIPLTSAQMVSFSGVGTPCACPAPTIPPLR